MKWKQDIKLVRQGQPQRLYLISDNKEVIVEEKSEYIADLLIKGNYLQSQLIELIKHQDKCDDGVAALTLADFLLDYQNYLVLDQEHIEIKE